MGSIPDRFHDLLMTAPTFTVLTTQLPTGLPHLSVVWIDYAPGEDRVLINTERGRRKERNVRTNPQAGILAPAPDNWYRWLAVSGEVDEVTTEGAREHIDTLARRYTDADTYQNPIQTERVIMKLRPDHVVPFPTEGAGD